jgi:hypothetical protein
VKAAAANWWVWGLNRLRTRRSSSTCRDRRSSGAKRTHLRRSVLPRAVLSNDLGSVPLQGTHASSVSKAGPVATSGAVPLLANLETHGRRADPAGDPAQSGHPIVANSIVSSATSRRAKQSSALALSGASITPGAAVLVSRPSWPPWCLQLPDDQLAPRATIEVVPGLVEV